MQDPRRAKKLPARPESDAGPRGLVPELSSVKRFRAKCVRATGRIKSTWLLAAAPIPFLYPIRIILEQVQNIVTGVNTDKGVFIGFLFPSPRKTGALRSDSTANFFYPRATPRDYRTVHNPAVSGSFFQNGPPVPNNSANRGNRAFRPIFERLRSSDRRRAGAPLSRQWQCRGAP